VTVPEKKGDAAHLSFIFVRYVACTTRAEVEPPAATSSRRAGQLRPHVLVRVSGFSLNIDGCSTLHARWSPGSRVGPPGLCTRPKNWRSLTRFSFFGR